MSYLNVMPPGHGTMATRDSGAPVMSVTSLSAAKRVWRS